MVYTCDLIIANLTANQHQFYFFPNILTAFLPNNRNIYIFETKYISHIKTNSSTNKQKIHQTNKIFFNFLDLFILFLKYFFTVKICIFFKKIQENINIEA